jgi:hypothetical protein
LQGGFALFDRLRDLAVELAAGVALMEDGLVMQSPLQPE